MPCKAPVYNRNICFVMLYGCDTWSPRAVDVQKLSVFDHRYFRQMLHVQLEQRVVNIEIPNVFSERM